MFTLEEKSREWERRHPEYTPRATPENERRYAEMQAEAEELAELDEEILRILSGTPYDEIAEEPTEFDPFEPELRTEIIELAEMAVEAAQTELGVFGCIAFEPQLNWDAECEDGELCAMFDIEMRERWYIPAELC